MDHYKRCASRDRSLLGKELGKVKEGGCFQQISNASMKLIMRLFHFSENPSIEEFVPRAVAMPADRQPGDEWLNDPLVWAIDEAHQFLYLFPRECPRILIWPKPTSTEQDKQKWMGKKSVNVVAYIETGWLERLKAGSIFRYELPATSFTNLADAGMWVSKTAVTPISVVKLEDLNSRLELRNVVVRPVGSLLPLRPAWDSTLHVSGIRLRNAKGWQEPEN